MKKFLAILLTLFPMLVLADGSSISFTPPTTDYSVFFLGNIFGIVDGVLHGNGSQILGSMFAVFNAAVLALGGIFIMYTLMVSTMNTAHEGQMMGQKWSSMWIPIRSTVGMALLIPKASGYCMMQIFVMWVVVQGVGAADKVWDAALSYLNRGGVIIQAQMKDPTTVILDSVGATGKPLPMMAQGILASQVCMLGLQRQMEAQLKACQKSEQSSSLCGKYSTITSIPDFINTVNVITTQNPVSATPPPSAAPTPVAIPNDTVYRARMPDFGDVGNFADLTGKCGTLEWKSINAAQLSNINTNSNLLPSELSTVINTRAIALQQMYLDLAVIAQTMIANNPGIGLADPQAPTPYTSVAKLPFGIPQTASQSGTSGPAICEDNKTEDCFLWGSPSRTLTPLFNGSEFQNAVQDYNSIMLPTLQLMKMTSGGTEGKITRSFIQKASASGWIMAGSYFFDLVRLNITSAQDKNNMSVDSDTGFKASLDINNLTDKSPLVNSYLTLEQLAPIRGLIDGQGVTNPPATSPVGSNQIAPQLGTNLKSVGIATGAAPRGALYSSTVYGFTTNSYILTKPGQPGQDPLTFANMMNIKVDTAPYMLSSASFDCGSVNFGLISWCLGRMFGEVFYNFLFLMVYNLFVAMFGALINQVLMAFLMVPLSGMATIFQAGLQLIAKPGVNPIIGLAQMGTYYINFSAQLWLQLIQMAIVSILVPVFGLFILPMVMMTLPLLMAWMGVMVSIGFSTAYYVPMLPYILFTFGSIAWLMAVIEAMVAAPIVALGVTHPEGHEAFGKSDPAIMILMNVFLRPSMMIIGYITAISLCYVSVWIINAGFDHAIGFIQKPNDYGTGGSWLGSTNVTTAGAVTTAASAATGIPGVGQGLTHLGQGGTSHGGGGSGMGGAIGANTPSTEGGYVGWAGIYAFFFSILVYTTLYLTVVQKAFTLIAALPDKVLRWIGGQSESVASETAQWAQEAQGKIDKGGDATSAAQGQMDKQLSGAAGKALQGAKDSGGGKVTTQSGPAQGGGDGGKPSSAGGGDAAAEVVSKVPLIV